MISKVEKPKKWTSFIVVTDFGTQKKIVKRLKPQIEQFDYYNFNYYYGEIGEDHLSIRVYGGGKKELAEDLDRLSKRYHISWYKQAYNAEERKAYELGTRCAFIYMDMKRYLLRDNKPTYRFLIQAVHGFLDNIGVGDKQEGKLHLKMAWHFLVKKPLHLWIRRLRTKF